MKKILSFLLSIVMLTSVLCGISFNALAENGYPYAVDPGVYVADQWGFYQCECTSYCAYKLNTVNGVYFHNTNSHGTKWGDAGNWDDFARNLGITVNSTPAVGSIFYNNPNTGGAGNYGHVAWVSAVNGDYVTLEEYNWDTAKHKYHTRTVLKSKASGYIHIKDISSEEPMGYEMSAGAGQTIPDGNYWIASGIAQDYFLDIPGNDFDTKSGANVQMWTWSSLMPPKEGYDVFTVKYLNNGYYKIYQMNTNMCIDHEADSLYRRNIQMWGDRGDAKGQQWSIEPTAHGYTIRCRCNSYCMDVADGAHDNGVNVRCWDGNGAKAQSFSFIPYTPNEKPISDGVYTIKTKINTNHFLDVSGEIGNFYNNSNVQLWTSDSNDNEERYLIKYAGDGWYSIAENTSGLRMEITAPAIDLLNSQKNIQVYQDNGGKHQLWKIRKNADGSFFIINKASGYYLDLEGGNLDNETNVSQNPYNGTNHQRWILTMDKKPAKPVVSVTSKDKAVTVSWTKCPAVNKYDKRTYSVSVYQKADNGATKQIASKTGLTDTKYTFTAPAYGKYFFKVTAVNTNYENYKTASAETAFTVKGTNPIVVKGKTVTVKYAKVKKKAQTVTQKNAFAVSKAQGKVTYSKASGNKKITVSSAGKVTVKKGLKKGTYKIKVKVKAAGNTTYKAATKTVTVTIKVK